MSLRGSVSKGRQWCVLLFCSDNPKVIVEKPLHSCKVGFSLRIMVWKRHWTVFFENDPEMVISFISFHLLREPKVIVEKPLLSCKVTFSLRIIIWKWHWTVFFDNKPERKGVKTNSVATCPKAPWMALLDLKPLPMVVKAKALKCIVRSTNLT